MIDALGPGAADAELPEIERPLPGASNLMIGFPHYAPSGRVEATARGNEIEIRSRGVRSFRLLLSPRQFDLSRPLRVRVNGVVSHQGSVSPNARTLLRWAARDLDRSMLFVAELEIHIPPRKARCDRLRLFVASFLLVCLGDDLHRELTHVS